MKNGVVQALIIAAGMSVHAGCAGLNNNSSYFDRFVLHPDQKNVPHSEQTPAAPQESLEEAIAKVQRLMAEARPEQKTTAPTLESQNPELTAALAAATAFPAPAQYVRVAALYHRHGLLDKAYDYYRKALRMDRYNGDAYEGLARVWRDWHAPQLAVGDAQRAVAYAPKSASARNTLGTVLQALGQRGRAREQYLLATRLDSGAAYAFSNLCQLSHEEGRDDQAISECQYALQLNPGLSAAHNNLGFIYATTGKADLARIEFEAAAGPVSAAYKLGMVYLTQARFKDAANEFDIAHTLNPSFLDAARRSREAHRLAAEQHEVQGK